MVILTDLSIIELGFSGIKNQQTRILESILFNKEIKICLNKSLISVFENFVSQKDEFYAFITELSDTGRIILFDSNSNLSFGDQLKEIILKSKISFLIPITLSSNCKYLTEIKNVVIIDQIKKANSHWIATELLSKNSLNVCYKDFNSDDEIDTFFDSIFLLPNYIKLASVFNRGQDFKYLKKLKGRNIEYYTLLSGENGRIDTQLRIKSELVREFFPLTELLCCVLRQVFLLFLICISISNRNDCTQRRFHHQHLHLGQLLLLFEQFY